MQFKFNIMFSIKFWTKVWTAYYNNSFISIWKEKNKNVWHVAIDDYFNGTGETRNEVISLAKYKLKVKNLFQYYVN